MKRKKNSTATAGEQTGTHRKGKVCDLCYKPIADNEKVYPDRVSGKLVCKTCDRKLRKQYREEYFHKRNQKRKVWETVLIALGTVLFTVLGIGGVMDGDTRVIGIIFLLAGIGYGIWLVFPWVKSLKEKRKEKESK